MWGTTIGGTKGDTRSLDYSSHDSYRVLSTGVGPQGPPTSHITPVFVMSMSFSDPLLLMGIGITKLRVLPIMIFIQSPLRSPYIIPTVSIVISISLI